jgi:hypothetical protein
MKECWRKLVWGLHDCTYNDPTCHDPGREDHQVSRGAAARRPGP